MEDGMGLSDIIYPMFLFAMGMSVPYALERRFEKGAPLGETILHILSRTLALLLMGAFICNAESPMAGNKGVYWLLMVTGFFLVWSVYPEDFKYRKPLRIAGVIILAATNRVDMLDKALLRAGRFDRQIHVDLPDLPERKAIFNVHLKPLKVDPQLDIDLLSRQTPGFSGADIANVCNEAALIAARHGSKVVGKQDFLDAVDRIIGGLEKKTKVMTDEEKRAIALHEAGHATVSWFCEHANPLVKVSIVPRGRALGAAWYLPEERQLTTKEQLLDEMCSLMGGRAAEELFTGHISTGAMNDLERATKMSQSMIAYYGMSEKLPNVCYYDNNEYAFTKPYSAETARIIDDEVLKMVNEQYDRAKQILLEHKEGHNALALLLIQREVIFADDVEKIFGKRQWTSRAEEIINDNDKKDE